MRYFLDGWLGSQVVSMLDSGEDQPGYKMVVTLSVNSLRQTDHTHCASVHQATKLVAVFLRVVGVTAGLAKSNGSLPPGLWLTSPTVWLPKTRISSGTLGNRVWVIYIFYVLYIFTTFGNDLADETVWKAAHSIAAGTRSSAIAEGPRHASCQLKSCQLLRNSAETTCTTSPEEIKVMKLDNCTGLCILSIFTQLWRVRVTSTVL